MTRSSYRWDKTLQKIVEVGSDEDLKARAAAGPFVMPDIKEFVSPIDGSVISSRSTLRRHEVSYGVRQCGDLKPGDNVRAAKAEHAANLAAARGADFKWI